ncbi:hypothetical protein OVY29_12595 [Sphingopyxis sp. SE2]|jgi:hypothetical protein|uniref:hypothetical protein n=1 Tax=unclassified Sphingopyxis TaxID=2614943 RepID=UPI00050FF2AD|nr:MULTISPECIES: hypothetical protein [unclassified Sphingopyxis]KGB55908.1 hypothetical protein FG95_02458 [Sphingopyxis sp. LC363]MDT7529504.1 hypothetical protein [Sphingopyxis sp. SE2]
MSYQLSSFRRFPTAFAVVAASALAFTGLMASTTPAYAQSGGDYRCAGLAEQAHVAASGVEGAKQSSAKRFVSTGKKLCEAGNERAAAKQFRAALKIAGVAEVETDSQMASR